MVRPVMLPTGAPAAVSWGWDNLPLTYYRHYTWHDLNHWRIHSFLSTTSVTQFLSPLASAHLPFLLTLTSPFSSLPFPTNQYFSVWFNISLSILLPNQIPYLHSFGSTSPPALVTITTRLFLTYLICQSHILPWIHLSLSSSCSITFPHVQTNFLPSTPSLWRVPNWTIVCLLPSTDTVLHAEFHQHFGFCSTFQHLQLLLPHFQRC